VLSVRCFQQHEALERGFPIRRGMYAAAGVAVVMWK